MPTHLAIVGITVAIIAVGLLLVLRRSNHVPDKWDIVCSQEQLQRLRTNRGFQRLVALGRIVNELRFAQLVLPTIQGDDSPSGKRQRMNSFFLTGALLYEGMQLGQRLAQDYRHRPSFEQGLALLLRNERFTDLLAKYLKRLRNEAVFHVDENEIESRLAEYAADPVIFVSGRGNKSGYTYYELGDIMAMMALVGPASSNDEFMRRTEDLMARTTALAIGFLSAADKLIADLLDEFDFAPRRG